ncbi:MAG: protein kinase domain-containing protein [Acidobacteriota bacterium]
MELRPGTVVGPYTISALLGRGGMGEVYRAHDPRLGRDVALKVLPSAFAGDPDRLRRFEQEARAAAALSHPNIVNVHDVGHDYGVWYVVAELLDGQTLRERLSAGALPIRLSIDLAVQIANGLAAAHDKGIVHRDLKPENVFVTRDDRVKILDFGIAKLTEAADDAATVECTAPGIVVGSAGYMSPEQVRGVSVDHRADIFSFGTVLHEMVTGTRAFAKPTPAQTMTAILEEDPAGTPPSSPLAARVLGLARRCLEKAPQRRFQSARDLALVLSPELMDGEPANQLVRTTDRSSVVVTAVVAILGVALGALAGRFLWSSPNTTTKPITFSIALPPEAQLSAGLPLAVAPDGNHIVFSVVYGDGRRQLLSRKLDRDVTVPVDGTEGAESPFFSPDGGSLAFFADGHLKRIPASGGVPTVICRAPSPRGGVWAPGDRIILVPESAGGLFAVSASGGTLEALTTVDGNRESSHRWPAVLPDGSGVLFTVLGPGGARNTRVDGMSLETRVRKDVQRDAQYARYASTGHLVFVTRNGETFRAPFDGSQLAITGAAEPLPERPTSLGPSGAFLLEIAHAGTLITSPFEMQRLSPVVVRRDGSTFPLPIPPGVYRQPVISPDGRRVAFVVVGGMLDEDIWLHDAKEGTFAPFTFNRFSRSMVWMRDSNSLVYNAVEGDEWKLLRRGVELDARPELLHALPAQVFPIGWLSDDRTLVYGVDGQSTPLVLSQGKHRPVPLPEHGPALRYFHAVSPDRRWLAFTSNHTGQWETYIASLPDARIVKQVSRGGGSSAQWAKKGSELFYRRPHEVQPGEIMRVEVGRDGSVSAPALALRGDYFRRPPDAPGFRDYDVFPDGSFLMLKADGPPATPRIEVVVNWASSSAASGNPR